MENLPVEITTDILLRLPLKSIGQGRCVSKLWCSILYHDDALKLWEDILLIDYRHRSSRIVCLEDNEKKFDSDFITKRFFGHACVLGSYNGFFFLAAGRYFPCNPIYVFNPITEEHAKLPDFEFQEHDPPTPYDDDPDYCKYVKSREDRCFSGLGFVDCTKKFKLVLIIFSGWSACGSEYLVNELQVHTLGTTTWTRKIGIVPDWLFRYRTKEKAVVNNGCLHWITMGLFIVSFHLGAEEFGSFPFPESFLLEFEYKNFENLTLAVVEECLSIVECSLERGIHIWVMKTYNVKDSWVKQYSVEIPGCVSQHLSHFYQLQFKRFHSNGVLLQQSHYYYFQFIKFRNNGEVLLLCNDNCLVSYNPTTQECRFLEVEQFDEPYYFDAIPFGGSLISLKSTFGIDYESTTLKEPETSPTKEA